MKNNLFLHLIVTLAVFSSADTYAQRPATSLGGLKVDQTTAGTQGDSTNAYFGHEAGKVNTAKGTTFVGYKAGNQNSLGDANTGVGYLALQVNTTGRFNTAVGNDALKSNKTGFNNTAVGHGALRLSSGSQNSAFGQYALSQNTVGTGNTGLGYASLATNTLGSKNTALGTDADVAFNNLTNATAVGYRAVVSETNAMQLGNADVAKIFLGVGAGATTYTGKIITENIRCRMQASWPDYVFKSNYDLPMLTEVKCFIDTNGHLPNIPDAATVAKEGIDLGGMNARLLEKIEEITLYLIELDRKDTALQKEVTQLKAENEALKTAMMNSKTGKK